MLSVELENKLIVRGWQLICEQWMWCCDASELLLFEAREGRHPRNDRQIPQQFETSTPHG